MNMRIFLTPAYVTSLALLLIAGLFLTTAHDVIGWLVLLLGLVLNVAASLVTTNREQLRAAEEADRTPRERSVEDHR